MRSRSFLSLLSRPSRGFRPALTGGVLALATLFAGVAPASEAQPDHRQGGFPDKVAQGWHWYNEPVAPVTPEAPPAQPPLAVTPENATALMTRLQAATREAQNRALMFPSAENFRRYKLLQDFWVEKSSQFAQTSKEALLKYPELDYNTRFSHYNSTAAVRQAQHVDRQKKAIRELSARNGLFYFYRGREPVDVLMGVVVRAFVREYGISLIYVTVDGKVAPELPGSRPDNGQSARMHITQFPALFLVNPGNAQYQPLAYGFHAQEDLAEQFLLVASGFARDF
jgi:conjugal transfer pilus assembly protein TraF